MVSTNNFSHNKEWDKKICKNKTWEAMCFILALALLQIGSMILVCDSPTLNQFHHAYSGHNE